MTPPRHTVLQLSPNHSQKHYTIVRRVPQLTGDPEYAVVEECSGRAEAIALFFADDRAREYVTMLERKP